MKRMKPEQQKKLLRIGCLILAGVLIFSIVGSLIFQFAA